MAKDSGPNAPETDQPSGIYSIPNLKRIAYLLDDQFKVPFTPYRLGWDFILGLVPIVGDLVTAIMSMFLLVAARKYKIPDRVLWRMLLNIIIDFLIGLIPAIGDVVDAAWKANAKNVKLLLKAIEEKDSHVNPQ